MTSLTLRVLRVLQDFKLRPLTLDDFFELDGASMLPVD